MDVLEPPYQFFHPQPEVPFELPVVRWEVGLAQRPITDPPYSVVKPTIRFHLATPLPPDLFLPVRVAGSPETPRITLEELNRRPYLDFTNQVLIRNILSVYGDLVDQPPGEDAVRYLERQEAVSPQRSRPLTLRLTRHGLRIDTIYDVQVVGP